MQCQNVKLMFDEYLDGTLTAQQRDELVRHFDTCPACQRDLAELEILRLNLRDMPIEPARKNFAVEAIAAATGSDAPVTQNRTGFMHWFGAGFAGALVAGLVLWGVITSHAPSIPQAPQAGFSISLYQPQKISLAFNSPADIRDVTVSIELPREFEVVGHEGRRLLSWKTNLKKGRNILTLPVVARGEGKGMMIARLSRNKQTKMLQVLLTTAKPGLSRYRVTGEKVV